MAEFKKNPNKVGAIWVREGQKGEWFSLTIDGKYYTANANNYKHPDNQINPKTGKPYNDPDFVIYKSDYVPEAKPQVQQAPAQQVQQAPVKKRWKR